MKVFISSVVAGFEAERDAAATAADSLGHEVKRSEDFLAGIDTPQQACLAGVRWADVVVVLLGSRYGERQESGLSATQEEYEEAKRNQRILAFVQEGVEHEPAQRAFVDDVRDWSGGAITGSFETPDELVVRITRALHDLELSMSAGPVDDQEIKSRAHALVPDHPGAYGGQLVIAAAFGPHQPILRPKAMEDHEFERAIHQEALLGPNAILDTHAGVDSKIEGSALILEQQDASVLVDQVGDVRLAFPVLEHHGGGLPAIVEDELQDKLLKGLRLVSWIVGNVDPTNRLTHVAPVVAILGGSYLGWRSREEQMSRPNEMTISMRAGDRVVVGLAPAVRPRQALGYDTMQIADDFVVLLRREYK